jgi:hypothetical protein
MYYDISRKAAANLKTPGVAVAEATTAFDAAL